MCLGRGKWITWSHHQIQTRAIRSHTPGSLCFIPPVKAGAWQLLIQSTGRERERRSSNERRKPRPVLILGSAQSASLPPTAPNYRLHHSFNANYSDFINFYFSHFDMEWQHSAATRKPCWKPSCWCMINQDKAIKSTAKQTEILALPIRNTREHPTQWPECNNNNALTTHHIVCPTPVKANYHSWLLWS